MITILLAVILVAGIILAFIRTFSYIVTLADRHEFRKRAKKYEKVHNEYDKVISALENKWDRKLEDYEVYLVKKTILEVFKED